MGESRQKPVLLVVDDEAVSLKVASSLLRSGLGDDFEVRTAGGGEAAGGGEVMAMVRELAPSLIVTDMYMPGMDGMGLLQRVRAEFPDVPVVVMTAFGSEVAAVEALRSGAASYVPKGRMSDLLVETVRWVLAVRSQAERHEVIFDHMTRLHRQFILPNRTELIAPVVAELQADLRRLDICPQGDLNRFGVAMTEALMNAMIHGNLGLPGSVMEAGQQRFRELVRERQASQPYRDRVVIVELRADRERAECVVRDEGDGFDLSAIPDPTDPEMLMRPHGRGLLLMRTFMDEVSFNEKGNELRLVKRLARTEGS
jgi:CheY-like chemotaxis protein/anti-sigma regulatory factor (Ser/Thr protein kinase)